MPLHYLAYMQRTIILITDDDEDDRYFLKQAIENKIVKALVVEASNGEEALQMLSKGSASGKIDLILLDMNMPGMSGLEVLNQVRSNPLLQYTPAVMVSTSDAPDLVSSAYAKGINSYIKKPNRVSDYDQIAEAIKICFLNTPLSSQADLSTVGV